MKEKPVLLLKFIGVPKLVPLLLLAAKKISLLPGVESSHVTYTLLPDVAICGLKEPPGTVAYVYWCTKTCTVIVTHRKEDIRVARSGIFPCNIYVVT